LVNANLSGADLTGVILPNANLSGTKLSGATWIYSQPTVQQLRISICM
jgi:uncharacterized protein YjbI with pentapeptide repeats